MKKFLILILISLSLVACSAPMKLVKSVGECLILDNTNNHC